MCTTASVPDRQLELLHEGDFLVVIVVAYFDFGRHRVIHPTAKKANRSARTLE